MMLKYRLCLRYDWIQKTGYSNIETIPCMGRLAPLASNKIIMGRLAPP